MNELLIFMGNHPILTFLLALIIFQCIAQIFKYISYSIKGKPFLCKECRKKEEDD